MRYLSLAEVLALHERVIAQSGGASGLRDLGALESAIAQPGATFDGVDLYPSVAEKSPRSRSRLSATNTFLLDLTVAAF